MRPLKLSECSFGGGKRCGKGLVCHITKIGFILDILGTISKLPGKGACSEDSQREQKLFGPLRSFGLSHIVCAPPKHFLLEKIVP